MELTKFASHTRLLALLVVWPVVVGCSPNESARLDNRSPAAPGSERSIADDSEYLVDDAVVDPGPRLLAPVDGAAPDRIDPETSPSPPWDEDDTDHPYQPVSISLETAGPSLDSATEPNSGAASCPERPPLDEPLRRLPPITETNSGRSDDGPPPRLALRQRHLRVDGIDAASPESGLPLRAPTAPTIDGVPALYGKPVPASPPTVAPPVMPHAPPQWPERRPPQVAAGALQAVADEAEQRVRNAFVLAGRGAVYAARAELVATLRMVSQALDAQAASTGRSKALAAGLLALNEADDFTPADGQFGSHVDLRHVISGHRTAVLKDAVLKDAETESLTSLLAAQQYYTFAQEQLAIAGGRLPAASLALFGLGKLQTAQSAQGSDANTSAIAKAMVFQQAALLVESRNFLAANELGVLLARVGQWSDARQVLRRGVTMHPQAELWKNLATVHQRLGETHLAHLAQREAERATMQTGNPQADPRLDDGGGFVRWVSPQRFAQNVGQDTVIPRSPTY